MTRIEAQAAAAEGKRLRHKVNSADHWIVLVDGVFRRHGGPAPSASTPYNSAKMYDDGWEVLDPETEPETYDIHIKLSGWLYLMELPNGAEIPHTQAPSIPGFLGYVYEGDEYLSQHPVRYCDEKGITFSSNEYGDRTPVYPVAARYRKEK